jgi:hypothetical protein
MAAGGAQVRIDARPDVHDRTGPAGSDRSGASDVLRPRPEAAHVAGVDADVVPPPVLVDQLELDPPGARAQPLLVELDDAGLRHDPERQRLCSGLPAAASSQERGTRGDCFAREPPAEIRSHTLTLLRVGAGHARHLWPIRPLLQREKWSVRPRGNDCRRRVLAAAAIAPPSRWTRECARAPGRNRWGRPHPWETERGPVRDRRLG